MSVIEERTGKRICCPEIISYENGWIDRVQLSQLAEKLKKSGYGEYFLKYLSQ